ncbi:MAG: glycerol-3-phosphate acyltransferase [Oscillospiraceae bacterium]|jgi:glycerol-3-phosphate acyltransferase PlsY|nr:glycerol-3-phosphate acyltransferase [Oscillospiraceae bacterium]
MSIYLGYFLFALGGFLSGSVMFSYLLAKWFFKVDIVEQGLDHNPGMTNVMRCVGTAPGLLCLALDVAKAAVPVFIARHLLGMDSLLFALVIAAPVIGHAFSPMLHFKGGKAIAASFGAFFAVSSIQEPVVVYLALLLALFSLVVVIKPDALRVIVCFFVFSLLCFVLPAPRAAGLGAVMIAATVIFKHITNYGDERAAVRLPFARHK